MLVPWGIVHSSWLHPGWLLLFMAPSSLWKGFSQHPSTPCRAKKGLWANSRSERPPSRGLHLRTSLSTSPILVPVPLERGYQYSILRPVTLTLGSTPGFPCPVSVSQYVGG